MGRGAPRDVELGCTLSPVHVTGGLAIGHDPVRRSWLAWCGDMPLAEDADGDAACARLLARRRLRRGSQPLLVALDQAMRGRRPDTVVPGPGASRLEALADHDPATSTLTRLAARLGSRPAWSEPGHRRPIRRAARSRTAWR